jgi:Ca-activated chloride channel family protein
MERIACNWFKHRIWKRIALLAILTILTGPSFAQQSQAQQSEAQQSELSPSQVGEGSLLYRSGASGQYQSIPLLHTDASIDVRGLVASATVTQQYANSSAVPIEAIYVFPLPHDAAVYDMEIRIGNRVIKSVVREREEAKRIYTQAKSEGKRAALLEQERPNIFTASVANIMPGDHIDVRMRYVQPLKWEAGKMRLVFPMVVGPRYIPGTQAVGHLGTGWALDTNAVPDASRITPFVRNPDSRSGHDISIAVDLDPGFDSAFVQSVSHQINVRRLADGRQRAELAAGATIPNKDFILEVQNAESKQPKVSLFLSPAADTGETNFLLAAFPPSAPPRQRMPVEMLYMVDISGSMEGTSIEQARGALLQALDTLMPTDRFGILAFSSGYGEFAAEPLPATANNLAAARLYVKNLQAGGGTEMLPALLHLMRKPQLPGYLRHIILLTDGDLGNEEEIFTALHSDLGNARLYTIAIGSEPNLFLATKMAQFGRGTFTHIADNNEIRSQMAHLFESIESPVLTDVKLSFEGVDVAEVYPDHLPDLFAAQPLLVYGHITRGRAGVVRLTAHAGDEPYETTIPFDTAKASFHPGITTLWARQRVEDLMDHWRQADPVSQAGIRQSVIDHAIRYHLVTRFTSLVAVEEVVVNPSGESSKAPVPSELPAGWQMEKVFGAPATGTADAFLETLGIALLLLGLVLLVFTQKWFAQERLTQNWFSSKRLACKAKAGALL